MLECAGPLFATVSHALDPSVPAEAGLLAKRCGVPPAVVLLAGAEVLAARWSGRGEAGAIASPHHGTAGTAPPRVSDASPLPDDYHPRESFLDLVVRAAARPASGGSGVIALGDHGARGRRADGAGRTAPPRLIFRTADDACRPAASSAVAAGGPRPLAADCELSVDLSAAEVVVRYAADSPDAASVRLLAPYYGALLTAAVAAPSTAVGSIAFAPPAAILRSPEALAELVRALPGHVGGSVTGARIVDGADGVVLPAALTGALHLEVRDGARTGGPAWVDTGARGRFTPTGGIVLERAGEPEPVRRASTSYGRLGRASAAGMASQLAAVWAASLGLQAVELGDGRVGLGDVLPWGAGRGGRARGGGPGWRAAARPR
ncbi:hypothetical protein, partial [Streptomyces sp. NPDC048332]|uniref:hypothetical protein n=1 Tax=Streptomyces sp. NPDC048332 TaxID=3154619 RepID=UPI003443BFEA